MKLNISNIQRFSISDGDGIRTTVFLKGCSLFCPWCHNPETISKDQTKLYYKSLNKTEICGKLYDPLEVFEAILKDKEYYDQSGGGVTFSGGEAMLQAKNLTALLVSLKENNISVFIDTAGYVPYENFEIINSFVDTYLYDIKTLDKEKFSQTVKGDLDLVVNNLKRLLEDKKNVKIRIPLVEGFNTSKKDIDKICIFLSNLGIKEVDLLKFHTYASSKWEAMGLDYKYKDVPPMKEKRLEEIKNQYSKYFIININN